MPGAFHVLWRQWSYESCFYQGARWILADAVALWNLTSALEEMSPFSFWKKGDCDSWPLPSLQKYHTSGQSSFNNPRFIFYTQNHE